MRTRRLVLLAALALSGAGCTTNHPANPAPASAAQPANIDGIWRIVADTPSGVHQATMFVAQSGRDINGRFEGDLGVMHYAGSVEGDQVRFGHLAMAGSMRFDYTGTVGPDGMKGTAVFGNLGTGTWTATRVENP